LNASRFDLINKDPKVGSMIKHIPQVQFQKQTDRKRISFSKEQDKASAFYESKKEFTMPRLDICSPTYERSNQYNREKHVGKLGIDTYL